MDEGTLTVHESEEAVRYSIKVDGILSTCSWEYDARPMFEVLPEDQPRPWARMRWDLPPVCDDELDAWQQHGATSALVRRFNAA